MRNTGNLVWVFVDRDYHYGYFVDENVLFSMLEPSQQAAYLAAPADIELDVSASLAQQVIDIGVTPYARQRVLPA